MMALLLSLITVAIEGETKGTYAPDALPGWISTEGDTTRIDLGDGHLVTYDAAGARFEVPGYGTIQVQPQGGKLALTAPQPYPDWLSVSDTKVSATTPAGRFSYSRSKVETFRYEPGWEMFFFTLDSPFAGKGPLELAGLALWGDRVTEGRSNIGAMLSDFWNNQAWHHRDVAWAMFETVLMAFLGTLGAGLVGGISPGFRVTQGGDYVKRDSNGLMRVVRSADLIEISAVTKPAYPAAQIEARNWTPDHAVKPRVNAAQRWRA